MSSVVYPALASRADGGGYEVSFPDFPGLQAHAQTQTELLIQAREALRGHLEGLAAEGAPWPDPSEISTLQVTPPTSLLLVDVSVDDPPVRVNISIGERLLRRMDEAAARRGMTRSGFIAEAAREALDREARPGWRSPDLDAAAANLQAELSAAARKLKDQFAPNSTFNRSLQELDDRVSDAIRRTADSVSAAVSRRKAGRPETEPQPPPA